jgi:hypothetical protein
MARNEQIGQKRIELRNRMFPHVKVEDLWHRKTSTGFTTIPRGLPLVMSFMDKLSKGKPVSSTYFELWCRMFDESFINLKPREMAYHAGFSGQRAEQTWSERMKILANLGFIETKPGPEGDLSFAVVFNPYKAIKRHFESKPDVLDNAAYNALIQRLSEIGATDLDEVPPAQNLGSELPAPASPTVGSLRDRAEKSAIKIPTRKLALSTNNPLPSNLRRLTGQMPVKGGK